MAVQAIVYSKATGRVRRVVDPEADVPNVIAFLAQAKAGAGEAVLVYTKAGNGQDTLAAWQAAINVHTGLNPDTAQADWYVEVDSQNNILTWHIADPACGDLPTIAGATLVQAPWGTDSRWTYNGTTFTAPPIVAKPT